MIFELITIMIGSAILSIEIAYNSELALKIKKLFFVADEPKIIKAVSQWGFWSKLLNPTWGVLLFPVYGIIVLLTSIYLMIVKLFNCPYCLSFWLGGVGTYFLIDGGVYSIYYGCMTLLLTHIIEKIYNY